MLQATRRLLRTGVPPDSAQADERYHAIVSYLAVLSHRGIDTESVLKIALMSDVVVSLVAPALVNLASCSRRRPRNGTGREPFRMGNAPQAGGRGKVRSAAID